MERKQEKRLGSLIEEFVRAHGLEEGFAEYRVKKYWADLLGVNVANATRELYIKDRKLFVKIHSSVMRNELSMMKDVIIIRLNEQVGMEAITDIIFR